MHLPPEAFLVTKTQYWYVQCPAFGTAPLRAPRRLGGLFQLRVRKLRTAGNGVLKLISFHHIREITGIEKTILCWRIQNCFIILFISSVKVMVSFYYLYKWVLDISLLRRLLGYKIFFLALVIFLYWSQSSSLHHSCASIPVHYIIGNYWRHNWIAFFPRLEKYFILFLY